MYRKYKFNVISIILVISVILAGFSSCSGSQRDNSQKDVYLDDVPSIVDFKNDTVKIAYWDNSFVEHELTADNDKYDFIDSSILQRNESIEERLGVQLEFVKGDNAPEYYMPQVQEEILAGTFDCDIISGVQCQAGMLCINGCYLDLTGAKYLDITKPYWAQEYIDELRIGNDRLYMLGGDISLTTTAWASAMLVDENLYNEVFGDVNELYQDVLDGKWTLDMMFDTCRKTYKDLNNNGERDVDDRYGFGFRRSGSSIVDMFCFSSGVRYSLRDQSNIPILNVINDDSVEFCRLFCENLDSNEGIWSYNTTEFDSGNNLFVTTTLDALRDEYYQNNFGVIPYPKLNTSVSEYHSWLSDNTLVYSVPVTLPEDRTNMVSAVLEVMASETRRICLPAYYETALGDAYVRDDWSKIMLEIIHDGITADFVSIYSIALNHVGGIMRQQVGYGDFDIKSNYEALHANLPYRLKNLIRIYDENTLTKYVPKVNENDNHVSGDFLPENQIADNWDVFGVKYRSSGIIIPRDLSSSFAYTVNQSKGISVRSPSVEMESGTFPTSAVQSKKKLPLKDLSVTFKSDTGFKYNNIGYSASYSFIWTTQPIAEMPQYTDQIGTNGLRETVPVHNGAYALSVVFMGTKNTSESVSDLMYIILHDGTEIKPEDDGRIGYRWTNYVKTDLSKGVNIDVKEDDELGFVVVVNGVEYKTGMRGTEELPIDLNILTNVGDGHMCMGVGVTGADEGANFTWSTINGEPASIYFE